MVSYELLNPEQFITLAEFLSHNLDISHLNFFIILGYLHPLPAINRNHIE